MTDRKIIRLDRFRAGPSFDYRPNAGLELARATAIRTRVRGLITRSWRAICVREGRRIGLRDMLPIDPRFVVMEVLGWQYDEPHEIVVLESESKRGAEIAGMINRSTRTITVAGKFDSPIKRFTAAHELGHLSLHPNIISLRESPLMDSQLRRPASPKEREANLFAAEFLMPTQAMREAFRRRYGRDHVQIEEIDDDFAFYFAEERSAYELQRLQPVDVARTLAAAQTMVEANDRPLIDVFGVSATAMAFQWLDLGLVRI